MLFSHVQGRVVRPLQESHTLAIPRAITVVAMMGFGASPEGR